MLCDALKSKHYNCREITEVSRKNDSNTLRAKLRHRTQEWSTNNPQRNLAAKTVPSQGQANDCFWEGKPSHRAIPPVY